MAQVVGWVELPFPDQMDPGGKRDLERSFDNHNLGMVLRRCLLDIDMGFGRERGALPMN